MYKVHGEGGGGLRDLREGRSSEEELLKEGVGDVH